MKKIDELKNELETAKAEAQTFLSEKKVSEAKAKMEEVKNLKESIAIQEQLDAEALEEVQNKIDNKKEIKEMENKKQSANTVRAMIKKGMGKPLTEAENALLIPATGNGTNGEGFILPVDVTTLIKEKIRSYKSLREVLGYLPTTALSGSFAVEDFDTLTELVDFTDGTEGVEPSDIKFSNVSFKLKEKGAIIKLSNTLLQMTDNNLIEYIARVFAKKAVITENKMAITAMKTGKTAVAVADIDGLKSVINVTLDPAVLYDCAIVTNQDGFNKLDQEKDGEGKPYLQPDPTNSTRKVFGGYPVHVYSNALIPTVASKAPIFVGNLREAVAFVDNDGYSFATSEHAGFTSNSTFARVIEHVDCIQVDKSDKIYVYGELDVATA